MEANLQHLLSDYCKCANCDELMGTVFIMNKKRFCEKCVQIVVPNDNEEWSGFEKSGNGTLVCKIYRDYLRNEPIFHSELGRFAIDLGNSITTEAEEDKKIEEYLKLGIKSSKKTLTIDEEMKDIEEYLKADSGQSESDSTDSDSEEMSD